MRALLLILILAVVGAILAIASGFLSIDQTRPAQVPVVETTGSGVTATGGQAPAFDVETGSVAVGATQRDVTVAVPTVRVQPPGGDADRQPEPPANADAPAAP